MKKSKNENKIKTVFNIYEPLVSILNDKFAETCLKRDAYLDKAIFCESGFLRKEVTIPNSDKAKSYISNNLKQLKLKPVNLLLSKQTVELMNDVCKEKNIPRDAFINRIFLLMIASDTIIETLYLGLYKQLSARPGWEADKEDWEEALTTWGADIGRWQLVEEFTKQFDYAFPNILDNIEAFVVTPPFWRLRSFFNSEGLYNLYNYPFEKYALNNLHPEYGSLRAENTIGFNTFMSDDEISKQEIYDSEINKKAETDKLLAAMQREKKAGQIAAQQAAQQELAKKEKYTPEKAANTKLIGETQ